MFFFLSCTLILSIKTFIEKPPDFLIKSSAPSFNPNNSSTSSSLDVKKTMESVSSSEHHMFTIPLDVNVNSGNNWEEAH